MDDGGRDGRMHLKPKIAKDCQPPPEARKEAWDRYPSGFSRRDQSKPHLGFGLLASTTVTGCISVVLSRPAYCNLSQPP